MSRLPWTLLALLATSPPRPSSATARSTTGPPYPSPSATPPTPRKPPSTSAKSASTHDPRFIHLLIDFGRVVNPRSLHGAFSILFDADANPATGWTEQGLAAVGQALAAGSFDAVIVAGDFNLVASRDPLDRLAASLDRDGSPLFVAEPLQLNGLSNATWLRRGSPFLSGRLDYVLYSNSSLRLLHSFVLRSTDLPTRWLRRHHLQPDDSDLASDHLPLVSDFQWR